MRALLMAMVMIVACVTVPPPAPMFVQGAPGSQDPPPVATTEDPNSGTVECKDETMTGSLISHTVCRTKETNHDQRNQDTTLRSMETPKTAPLCCPP